MARTKQTARKSAQALVPRQLYAYAEESSSSDSEKEVPIKKARSSNANDDGTQEKTGFTLNPDYELANELVAKVLEYVPRDGLDALRATCSSNRDFIDEHMQDKCLRKIKSASASYEDGEPDPTQRCNNWRHSHLWGEDKEPGYNITVVALVDGNEIKKEETFDEDEAKEAAKYLAALLRNADLQDISLVNGKDFVKTFKLEAAPLQLTVHGTLQFESVDSLSHTNVANIIGCFNTINVLHMRPQDSAGKINDEFLHVCVQHNVARLYLPNEATPGVTDDGIVDFCFGSDVACECLQSSMKPNMRKLHVRTPKITPDFLDRLAKANSESTFKNRLMFKTWGLFPGNSRKLRDEFCTAVKAHQSQVTMASGSGNWTFDFVAGDMRMKVCYNIEGREISVMRALQTDVDFFKQNKNRFY